MGIKRITITTLGGLYCWISMLLTAQVSVPWSVKQFYSGMEILAENTSPAMAGELTIKMNQCFVGDDNSGMSIPNDFKHIEIDADKISHDNATLTSNNYINKLYEYVYEKRMLTPKFSICSCHKTGSLPTIVKNRMSAEDAFVATIVQKKFSYIFDGHVVSKEFTDTVYTHMIQNKICAIVNGMGMSDDNNVEHLKVKAALAYKAQRYAEAYGLFERIAKIDIEDAEPFYRLAIMTYYGKGCRRNKKKAANLMVKSSCRKGEFSYKADNVLINWKYPNTW